MSAIALGVPVLTYVICIRPTWVSKLLKHLLKLWFDTATLYTMQADGPFRMVKSLFANPVCNFNDPALKELSLSTKRIFN